ncbi:MAG: STAS domain-containing protein [Butyrivibrio sp.]|nr:STAS domain-containing protein [Butyrivibrio sp.]
MTITGDLTAQTVAELNKLIDEELDDVTDIVFKLDGLNYTSSAGLRAFLRAWKEMDKKGGSTVIEGITETVKDIFMVSGFDRFLEIRD